MKDSDYNELIELTYTGGGWLPANQQAMELSEQCEMGEIVRFKVVQNRDLNFHRRYMAMLNYIWGFLPMNFKAAVPKDHFYQWLKHLKGQYSVIFAFQDGTKLVEYESISFGRMNQKRFEDYIREQLPFIYENVIRKLLKEDRAEMVIAAVESEFEKLLAKL